jgi:DNA polymerase-3 subunit delta'
MIKVPRIDQDSIKTYLQSHHHLSNTRVDEISFLSEGDVSVALGHLHSDDTPMLPISLALFDVAKQNDAIGMRDWTDTFNGYNNQQQQAVLNYVLQLLRELLHSQWMSDQHLRLTSEEIKFIEQRPFLKGLNINQIERLSEIFSEALFLLGRNVHVKTLMYNSCLQIESALNSDVYK